MYCFWKNCFERVVTSRGDWDLPVVRTMSCVSFGVEMGRTEKRRKPQGKDFEESLARGVAPPASSSCGCPRVCCWKAAQVSSKPSSPTDCGAFLWRQPDGLLEFAEYSDDHEWRYFVATAAYASHPPRPASLAEILETQAVC